MICAQCGTLNPDTARFCSNCGSALAVPRPPEGERKLVSVLFADVVGSTEMGERLDPEQITEIMNGAFASFNASIARYGGMVSRLLGDAVLAIFGAPAAHEDDAERAVLAGLAIRDSAQKYGRMVANAYGVEFRVRVGIHTGLAVLATVGDDHGSEYTVMGDTANVAARMETAATPGTVLISADTYRFVKKLFDVVPRGATQVKGKSEPIETYEVSGPASAPGKVRGLEGITSPLVGRDAEMRELLRSVETARAEGGRLVGIVGEAGIGKSRLIAEARARAMASRPVWLEGRALSYGQTLAHYPWRQILRASIGARESDSLDVIRELLAREAERHGLAAADMAFLETMLGVESEATIARLANLQRVEIAQGIADVVGRCLMALAGAAPLVLVFDDLHWADEATLELIGAVSGLVRAYPIVIVYILRPDRGTPAWALLDRMQSDLAGRFTRIDLEPLSAAGSQMLLESLLYIEELPESVRALMLQKSEGNPFFLEEVIRSLIDGGHIVHEDGRWRAVRTIVDVAIPDTLAGLLTARIDRLPDTTKRVAQTASVIGRTFPYDVLDAVWRRSSKEERIDDLRPHLATLAMEELVREWARDPGLQYIFKHALTQEAAYNLLLLRRRKDYHRRVGEVLEELYGDRLDQLSPLIEHHFWLAEDWKRAARYALRAGEESERLAAVREASDHYDRAYEALRRLPDPEPGEVIDAILAWARNGYKLVPSEEVLRRLAEAEALARESGDKRRLALVLNWIGNVHFYLGRPSEGVSALVEGDRVAHEIGEENLVLAWTFLMTESLVDQNPRESLAQLDRVIELARRDRSEDTEAHAIAIKAMALARLGEFDEAEAALGAALDLVRRIQSPVKEADVLSAGAHMYYDMGQVDRGIKATRVSSRLAFEVDGVECAVYSMYATGMGYLFKEAWPEAVSGFEDALERSADSRVGSKWLKNRIRAGLALAHSRVGYPGAVEEMEDTLDKARAFEDDYTAALLARRLGECATESGDFERAHRYLDEALAYYRRNGMLPYLPGILSDMAALEERDGHSAAAREALEGAQQAAAELARKGAVPGEAADNAPLQRSPSARF